MTILTPNSRPRARLEKGPAMSIKLVLHAVNRPCDGERINLPVEIDRRSYRDHVGHVLTLHVLPAAGRADAQIILQRTKACDGSGSYEKQAVSASAMSGVLPRPGPPVRPFRKRNYAGARNLLAARSSGSSVPTRRPRRRLPLPPCACRG